MDGPIHPLLRKAWMGLSTPSSHEEGMDGPIHPLLSLFHVEIGVDGVFLRIALRPFLGKPRPPLPLNGSL